MRCDLVQELFSEIYDGVAREQAALERHIKKCEACMLEYEAYRHMLEEISLLPKPGFPPWLHDTIMGKIREIAPPSDQAIDELINGIETRERLQEAKRKKERMRKSAAITRRWAGVAAAACFLLMSIWAINTFDWPMRHEDNESFDYVDFAPQAAVMPATDAMPLYDEPEEESIADFDRLSDDVVAEVEAIYDADDIYIYAMPQMAEAADFDMEHESEDEMVYDVHEPWGRSSVHGYDYDLAEDTDGIDGAFVTGGGIQDYAQHDGVRQFGEAVPLAYHGTSRIWNIIFIAGLVFLFITLGLVAWSFHSKNVLISTGQKKG
ncbi:MAG: hypothetical protein FWE11_07935 [Defluviitaleaceae bacterium]|nr:hypothetical protein [Defluviitaleaceae bacterium]